MIIQQSSSVLGIIRLAFIIFLQDETYLCRRFTSFVSKYNLMSQDNLIVPIPSDLNESQPSQQPLPAEAPAASVNLAGTMVKKPKSSPITLQSILNLPEGIIPDDDDNDEDDSDQNWNLDLTAAAAAGGR